MKCAVAIVLAFVGIATSNPVGLGYGYGYASPLLLPSAVSVSSSVVNHGHYVPSVVVTAPIIRPVVTPVVVKAPLVAWGGWGWGLGKGWH